MIKKYHKLFFCYIQHNNYEKQICIYNANFFIVTFSGHENVPLILESTTDFMI